MYNQGYHDATGGVAENSPRSLLTILFLVTLVSVLALGWFGWKLLDQERVVEAQRDRERLEQAADRIAAIARRGTGRTGERLGTWLIAPPSDGKPEDGLLLILSGANNSLSAMPGNRLLYRPSSTAQPEAFDDTFADGETFEFQQAQPEQAIERYRRLADSTNPEIGAGRRWCGWLAFYERSGAPEKPARLTSGL